MKQVDSTMTSLEVKERQVDVLYMKQRLQEKLRNVNDIM